MPAEERDLARAIVERTLVASKAPETEVSVSGSSEALTRFAGSAIHQNLSRRLLNISVRASDGARTGRASTTSDHPESLAATAHRALEVARSVEPNPQLVALLDPMPIPEVERFDPVTAGLSPHDRASSVSEVCRRGREANASAAGAFTSGAYFFCVGNSRGHLAYGEHTAASLSATITSDGSTGYAEDCGHSVSAIDPLFVGLRAASKAVRGRAARELSPGRYTAILEPVAVAEMMYFLIYGYGVSHWSALGVSEGRSFVAGRMGEKIFGENITIRDDLRHPLHYGVAFDAEGMPRRPLTLVEAGVARELTCDRATAVRLGVQPTGHGLPIPNPIGSAPANVVLEGGDVTVEQMIARAERAIVITRLWYNRLVDPANLIVTGLTRDGTFLVENGRVVTGLRNFRINQSLIQMLNNVSAASPVVRAGDLVVPALMVEDFNFSSVVPAGI